jgi:hypothetical protein
VCSSFSSATCLEMLSLSPITPCTLAHHLSLPCPAPLSSLLITPLALAQRLCTLAHHSRPCPAPSCPPLPTTLFPGILIVWPLCSSSFYTAVALRLLAIRMGKEDNNTARPRRGGMHPPSSPVALHPCMRPSAAKMHSPMAEKKSLEEHIEVRYQIHVPLHFPISPLHSPIPSYSHTPHTRTHTLPIRSSRAR